MDYEKNKPLQEQNQDSGASTRREVLGFLGLGVAGLAAVGGFFGLTRRKFEESVREGEGTIAEKKILTSEGIGLGQMKGIGMHEYTDYVLFIKINGYKGHVKVSRGEYDAATKGQKRRVRYSPDTDWMELQ